MSASKMLHGWRSINVPVDQIELDEARALVRMLGLQTAEKQKAFILASEEEAKAKLVLARLNSAIRRSGMSK